MSGLFADAERRSSFRRAVILGGSAPHVAPTYRTYEQMHNTHPVRSRNLVSSFNKIAAL